MQHKKLLDVTKVREEADGSYRQNCEEGLGLVASLLTGTGGVPKVSCLTSKDKEFFQVLMSKIFSLCRESASDHNPLQHAVQTVLNPPHRSLI